MSTLLASVLLCPVRAQAQSGPTTSTGTATAAPPAASVSTTSVTAVSVSTPSTSLPAGTGSVPRPWVIGEIAYRGNKNVKASVIRGEVKARKGDLYDRPDLDRDIQSVLGLGNFERVAADISPTSQAVPEHFRKVAGSSTTVRLTFFVTEKPLIKKIKFEGNKKVSKGVLGDTIALKAKDPLDTVKLKEDEAKIISKYNEKGFLDAAVASTVETDTTTLQSVVSFNISEGPKSKIFWVWAHGAKAFKETKVLKQMKNRRKKVYFQKDLKEDMKKIETFYLNRGYLDIAISTPTVWTSDDKTRIYIEFSLSEGKQYRFGETSFSGNLVYTSTDLLKAVTYRRGKIFNQEYYEETVRAFQELYAEKGRLRARVSPVKTYNPDTGLMDVHYGITEGDIVYIDHVDVEGNKSTKTFVLKREVVVKPGDMFQASRIRKSREKIMNLGFIDDVDIDIQSPTDPDKVDLTFDVNEGKPGVLTAGAAFSSVDGFIGTLSMQHMNLFGRAQRASAQWSFGRRVLDYSLSWTSPWIANHPTSLGLTAFNTRRVTPFLNDLSAYTQKSVGGSISVGPRFQEDKYHLNVTYTFSRISILGVDTSNPNVASSLSAGTSIYSALSAEVARDTRDNIWDPTRGSRHSLGATLSGGPLMGDINFFRPSLSNAFHFRLFEIEDYPFVLTLSNRAAYITPFAATKEIPVFDRFYVGGQDTLRGYSPAGQVGNPAGGNLYDVANAEFGFPLARDHRKTIVKFVFFFDAGSDWDSFRAVTSHIGAGPRDIKTDAGFGIRFTTPAFPIRLDWGYGFNHAPGEKRYEINFGLGNLF